MDKTPESSSDAYWKLLSEHGVEVPCHKTLTDVLKAEFDPVQWGYAQLSDLGDEDLRAVTSDQILTTADAVSDNLMEAQLHSEELKDLFDQLRYPNANTVVNETLRSFQLNMHVAGFFRAIGSALDCLAAYSIGTLRLPYSITKAAFNNLRFCKPPKSHSVQQQNAWESFFHTINRHIGSQPDGWLDWTLGMRNMSIHRARQSHYLTPEAKHPDEPSLAVVGKDSQALVLEKLKFMAHLPTRPTLPEMQALITRKGMTSLWLGESCDVTTSGILQLTTGMIEDVAQLLSEKWAEAAPSPRSYPSPSNWKLDSSAPDMFKGITGSEPELSIDEIRTSSVLSMRVQLAEAVRKLSKKN